jgi:hypothetical protein
MMVATAGWSELQVTTAVRSCMLPSVYVPVAVNCWVAPSGTLGIAGVTVIETSEAEVAVTWVEPDMPPRVADTLAVPTPVAVTTPAMLIDATPASLVAHVTAAVMSSVLPSEYVPVAVMAWVVPLASDGEAGVTAIDTNVGNETVMVVAPLTLPNVAVTVLAPCASAVARPPPVMEATDVNAEVQATELVKSWVLPSVYVPVAVNCWVRPLATDGFVGATAMETRFGVVTVKTVEPVMLPEVAAIVAVPWILAVVSPELETVATAVAEEVQLAEVVRFCVLPSV